jgi:Helix-turn-helix domain
MPKNIYPDANDPLFEAWDRASAQDGATPRMKDIEFLTLAEAAVLLRRSERTLRDWRKAGLLRTHKIGLAKLILAADLLPLLFGGKPNKISNDSSELSALNRPSNGPFDK